MPGEFIERRIVTGLIVSTDYVRQVSRFWADDALESPELRKVARWCLDYFGKYDRAPEKDVESLYLAALQRDELGRAEGELVEEILSRISDEFERAGSFNAAYLYDQTIEHFRDRELARHTERVDDLRERGKVVDAEQLAASFVPSGFAATRGLEVGTEEGYARIAAAFAEGTKPLLRYPGALGEMLNSHLVRDGFVAFLASEKRGKTWFMLDMAFRALRQKSNVAFFQAGDLTEGQMLRRLAIHVSRRSDDERYCQPYWRPVGDCLLNQFDACSRPDRNCTFGVYDEGGQADALPYDDDPEHYQSFRPLSELASRNPDYRPCDSATCRDRRPAVWLVREGAKAALTGPAASAAARRFFERYRRRFRLATYPSDTLTSDEILSCLDEWERQDDFVPDVIEVDYADLMTSSVSEFRHRQNAIWQGLRGVSQRRHALVVTSTQADADSYKAKTLKLSNFSEDKRKFAHVTAMWGLNQDPSGREKDLGILRVNELVVREGAFSVTNEVTVLQDLRSGRPFLESYLPR